MKVVDLGACRELLAGWDEVRKEIMRGKVDSYALCVRDNKGRETVYVAGDYKSDSKAALKAGLAISWELTKRSDCAG